MNSEIGCNLIQMTEEPFQHKVRLERNTLYTKRLELSKGDHVMRIRWISLMWLLMLALASCSPAEAEPLPSYPQEAPSQEASPTSTESPLPFDNTPESGETPSNPPPVEKFVSLAIKDLADRLKIETAEVTVVKTAEAVWPNAGLGCPSPGKVYAQGKVPGYQIRLEAGGVEYVYNTDLKGQVLLCPQQDPDNPNSLSPTQTGPTQQIGVPID